MFVVFVSNCKNKSLNRSRSILDRYANRISNRVWETKITEEGLHEIRVLLNSSANKFTSITCFKNEGRKKLKKLWNIGNSNYNINGKHIVKTISKTDLPEYIKLSCLIAKVSGLSHDLGKFTKMFQDKIRENTKSISDPVRHEWVSSYIFEKCLKSGFPKSTSDIKNYFPNKYEIVNYKPNFLNGVNSYETIITWLINSHHKLCGLNDIKNYGNKPDNSAHVRKEDGHTIVKNTDLAPEFTEEEQILLLNVFKKIEKLLERIKKFDLTLKNNKQLMVISRACLILADHTISSLEYPHKNRKDKKYKSYANTKNKELDQPLIWHLFQVSNEAGKMVNLFYKFQTDGVSESTIKNLIKESPEEFIWQDDGYDLIEKSYSEISTDYPCLVINCASTGKGKTRGNAKLAAAICLNRNKPVKLIYVLNLRTLTLQTGKEFKSYWKAKENELSCIIGEELIKKVNYEKQDYDGDEPENNYIVEGEEQVLPNFLKVVSKNKKYISKIIMSPCLVSTIDYIIDAGNPGRQANHSLALLKLKDNVLILDEIDSYNPEALVDVCKTVEIAGMLNCDVILSSATIPPLIMKMLFDAFYSGINTNIKADKNVSVPVFFIDENRQQFNTYNNDSVMDDFNTFNNTHPSFEQTKIFDYLRLGDIFEYTEEERIKKFYNSIYEEIFKKHKDNNFMLQEKNISFGFIRFANIKPLINFCAYLSEHHDSDYTLKVCSYHSADILAQRTDKEKTLDYLLKRNNGNEHILKNKEINKIISSSEHKNIIFVVVASPVEEIGRDHDFDWGIFEFSGMHNFIQGAGRINRHRKLIVYKPNISMLEYNYKSIVKKEDKVFCMPGLEIFKTWDIHNVPELLNSDENKIDKKFRFGEHKINEYESETWQREIINVNNIINNNSPYFGRSFHNKFKLRSKIGGDYIYTEYDETMYLYKKKKWEHASIILENSDPKNLSWNNGNRTIFNDIENSLSEDEKRKFLSVSLNTYNKDINTVQCINYKPWGYILK